MRLQVPGRTSYNIYVAIRTQIERAKQLLTALDKKSRAPVVRARRTASTPFTSYRDMDSGLTRLIVAYEGMPSICSILSDHFRVVICPDLTCRRSDFATMQVCSSYGLTYRDL
jgi:hypothetical protein